MITGLIGSFGAYIVAALAIVAGAFGLYKAGHVVGTSQAKAQAATDNATIAVAAVEKAADQRAATQQVTNDVQAKVDAVSTADGLANELQQFARPEPTPSGNTASAVQRPDTAAS